MPSRKIKILKQDCNLNWQKKIKPLDLQSLTGIMFRDIVS